MLELCTLHGLVLRVDLAIAVPLAQLWHSFLEVLSIGNRIQSVTLYCSVITLDTLLRCLNAAESSDLLSSQKINASNEAAGTLLG